MYPTLHSSMLPLLRILSDGAEHTIVELVEKISDYFNLSENERNEKTASGQKKVRNIIGWAKAELQAAGCIESPRSGVVKITERGLEVLKQNPEKIGRGVLSQFPEFRDWMKKKGEPKTVVGASTKKLEAKLKVEPRTTPRRTSMVQGMKKDTSEEMMLKNNIREAFEVFHRNLYLELANKLMNIPPLTFGKIVIDLLCKMGYVGSFEEASKEITKLGNEGVEMLVKTDKLGFESIYIQAKNKSNEKDIDIREIYRFEETMKNKRTKRGIYIAPGRFAQSAIDYVWNREPRILLINIEQLANLMVEYDVGVTVEAIYAIKKVDNHYFG